MWDTLWVDVNLCTMVDGPSSPGVVNDGAVATYQGRIVYAGPRNDLPDRSGQEARDVRECGGAWLTPGLIDCHTHIVYGGNRAREFEQRLDGATYAEIARAGGGIVSTVAATRAATEEELRTSSTRRLRDLLAEGITTVEIKSGYGLDPESELKMLRVARSLGEQLPVTVHTTLLGAHALPPEYAGRPDAYIDLVCNEMIPAAAASGLADAVDVFCENIAFDREQTTRVFKAAKKHGLPVKIHAEQLSDQGGAAVGARHGALSADHLEWVSEEGIAAMAEAGTVAVLLPGAFYFLRETRKPPVEGLRRHGVPIALATDCNPGSSPVTSLLLIANMGSVFFGLTIDESLAAITRNAAAALGIGRSHGTLEVGKTADMALWDIQQPADLVYNVGANPCIEVVKNGEIVKQV